MKLISREDAIRVIALERLPENSLNFCVKAYNDAIDRIQEVISQMDAIESRPKGKWRDYADEGFVECPFCESATNCDDNIDELHFCWSCGAELGADMKGEE